MVMLADLLRLGEVALQATSPTPRLDAEVLLGHVLQFERWKLVAELRSEVSQVSEAQFKAFIERRSCSEPVAYITGVREFWGLQFEVTPDVLIPRPETEGLVEEALRCLKEPSFSANRDSVGFVDLGTGSGCLACSITQELKRTGFSSWCTAVDLSPKALSVAERNAVSLGLEDQISFVESSWFSNRALFRPPYDFVVVNPPYIATGETVSPELAFEPKGALFADGVGLNEVRRIIEEANDFIRPGGFLICELGAHKRAAIKPELDSVLSARKWSVLGDDSEADRFSFLRVWY
jgi:release factor glutamine methyltransferase